MAEKLFTAKQIAEVKGLDAKTVIRLRKERKIPSVQLGYRTFVFELSAVESALSRLKLKVLTENRKGGAR